MWPPPAPSMPIPNLSTPCCAPTKFHYGPSQFSGPPPCIMPAIGTTPLPTAAKTSQEQQEKGHVAPGGLPLTPPLVAACWALPPKWGMPSTSSCHVLWRPSPSAPPMKLLTLFPAPLNAPLNSPNPRPLSTPTLDNSDASPANSNGPLTNSDIFSAAINTFPELPRLPPPFLTISYTSDPLLWFI
ncbi:hypothetical protein E4T56_gene19558 [Termitomyces sp. T112]|nr:hypothetical protein E4T56_gene19558 [Termitomyces sp. T112]